jgi:FixJ family two-component response regulator
MSKDENMIAIVDDDESVCRALKRLVRSLGMQADTFLSGQEFVDVIEAMPSFQVDCIILDVQMPAMNGLEVQRRLVALGNRIPIIFITAHDEPGVRERALGMGALAFLRKPFDDELFVRTLRVALGRAATGSPQGNL